MFDIKIINCSTCYCYGAYSSCCTVPGTTYPYLYNTLQLRAQGREPSSGCLLWTRHYYPEHLHLSRRIDE